MSKRFVYNTPPTQWYSGATKPKRKGVYQRKLPWLGSQRFSYWDGRRWYTSASTPDGALHKMKMPAVSAYQLRHGIDWRGLVRAA